MQYEEVQLYDMSVTLKEGYPAADAADFSELTEVLSESSEDWMPFCEIAMDLTGRSGVKTANVVIPQDTGAAQEYIRLRTEDSGCWESGQWGRNGQWRGISGGISGRV